jgi:hypothetical protein
MSSPDPKKPKKPYRPPVLTTYGNIRELTRNAGTMSTVNDKGGGGKTKTS